MMNLLTSVTKRYILSGILICSLTGTRAQKCLELNIVAMMGKLEAPGDAASSYSKCNTSKNDHRQIVIDNYGSDLVALDTLEARTSRDLNFASVAGLNPTGVPGNYQQQAADAQALAEKLKAMTPEQQKEWAMQMASQRSATAGKPIQDDPSLMKMVMQAQNIAVNQMKAVNDEFAAKYRTASEAADAEIKALPPRDKSKCPQDKEGLVYCGCANKVESAYWQKVITILNTYNNQKIATFQTYLPRIKALAGEVDDVVVKCKYGDALHSPDMKRMLLSEQASAYANSILMTTLCIENVRKTGSDAFVNKVNSDNGVYDLSCDSH
jgi:hypothetical protein